LGTGMLLERFEDQVGLERLDSWLENLLLE
jgi:hypothetical protein